MADVSSLLFGDAPEAVVESKDVISQEQKDALTKLLADLQGPAPQVSVPVTADQQTLIDTSVGQEATAQGDITQSTDVLKSLLDPTGSFEQQVQDPLLRDFREKILPSISRGFGNDFFSSERRTQDELASEDLLQSLTQEKSKFLRDDRATQLGAAQGFQTAGSARGSILEQFLQSAGVGRDIEETSKLKDESVRQELLKLLLGGATAPTKETVGISQGGSEGLLGGVLSGAASNPAIGAILSDERLKKNITRIGTYLCGAPKYLFQYVWGEWSIGVMAQELNNYVDGAVIITDSGYLAVDYSKFS